MTAEDRRLAAELERLLTEFDANQRRLPGIDQAGRKACFVGQLVESVRRVRYVAAVRERTLSPLRADPTSDLFDPIKAAILHLQSGDHDEASWLVFFSVHFGRALKSGWALAREVYLGSGSGVWTWARTSANPKAFRTWLQRNLTRLKGTGYRFGNHRKYQSLDGRKDRGTGDAVESYVAWVGRSRGHRAMFDRVLRDNGGDGRRAFDDLYESMGSVSAFGRMARFDYLTMIGKVGIAAIEPSSTYMDGATGPFTGARLLFGIRANQRVSRADLDAWLIDLGAHLTVGMQVIEDAVCNWQKSPAKFIRFRG